MGAAAVLVVIERDTVLTWLGSLLVAEDQLVQADVVVPLSGGSGDREIEAAELFRAGQVREVAMTLEPDESASRRYLDARGIHLPTTEERRLTILTSLGVPRDRIHVIRPVVTSTLDEARLVGEWASRTERRTVIVVTTSFHTARTKYVFARQARAPATRFIVRSSRLSEFTPDKWWTSRAMLREGIFEMEKLVAYRLAY
jgi:uncharacterized SAM-binding protein YcdF (DUF218 family)